ncbi:hypothetical protein PBY51_020945 [Eleginops maclovinus]|uniref:Uncharacterized protein n=1 Tax=Eleginops maclovinus TaxID=56733 RepID=A0AAN7XEV2_ELEMC|nr:hypothetical protein PBY51_020945 [Eleginops maclovinus]
MLFLGNSDDEVVRYMVELLGVPPDHLLKMGEHSRLHFVNSDSVWRLMSSEENWLTLKPHEKRRYRFHNLDDLNKCHLKKLRVLEADERKECIDLLKAMLHVEANKRITPSEVLQHPIIGRGRLLCSSDNETQELSTSHTTEAEIMEIKDIENCMSDTSRIYEVILPPGDFKVQPAPDKTFGDTEPEEKKEKKKEKLLQAFLILDQEDIQQLSQN